MRNIPYYRPDNVTLSGETVLISGQCTAVKANFLANKLKDASRRNCKAVVIDFGRTGDFTGILNHCGYHLQHKYDAEKDNYTRLALPVRVAINHLRTHAMRMGYEHSSYSQMTAFLSFLMEIDSMESQTVQQLLKKFRNQEKLEKILLLKVRSRSLSGEDAEDMIQTYLEYVGSGVTADTLLAELDFITRPNISDNTFSFSVLGPGEAAVLCASKNNSTDLNDYMSRLWTTDLIQIADDEPLLIVINAGHHSQIERMYELIETLSHSGNVNLFYCSYDLFSGAEVERVKAFAKLFNYNVFGRHANDSAEKISSMFKEQWLTQFNYADAHNHRIMGESLIDKMLGTDHTMTVSTTMVKESIIPAYSIVSMDDHEFLVLNTSSNDVQSVSISMNRRR